MHRAITTLALTATALLAATDTAAAAPAGPEGMGPLTTVAGWYRLADATGAEPWTWADPAADLSFTLGDGVRVEVRGAGSWCIQPDTREQHTADDGHFAVCTSPAPDSVPASWARPAVK